MVKRRKMAKTKGMHDVKLSKLEPSYYVSPLCHEHSFILQDTENLCLFACTTCKALYCNSCGKIITDSYPSQLHGKYWCTQP